MASEKTNANLLHLPLGRVEVFDMSSSILNLFTNVDRCHHFMSEKSPNYIGGADFSSWQSIMVKEKHSYGVV